MMYYYLYLYLVQSFILSQSQSSNARPDVIYYQ